MNLFLFGFTLTFHLSPSLWISMASNPIPLTLIIYCVHGSDLGHLFFIQLYSAQKSIKLSSVNCKLSSVNCKLIPDDTQLLIIFSRCMLSQKQSNSYKIQCLKFPRVGLQTFNTLTLQKLNFALSIFQHNLLKFIIPHMPFLLIQRYNLFLLFETLVLFFTLIYLLWSYFVHFLNS